MQIKKNPHHSEANCWDKDTPQANGALCSEIQGRPDQIQRGRVLVANPGYPSKALLKKLSHLFAAHFSNKKL